LGGVAPAARAFVPGNAATTVPAASAVTNWRRETGEVVIGSPFE
jgi:hypothetical protein